ncbi:hypothetical protein [Photobacterium kishitanii]|uniref:Uncharacterized protein n=1 Tax=Photobacterium kishitanii TaxID=318456 RepID=A0A2T3KA59_9GAMM|nr:hypothetical protein [Photobacterium kishitanii]PSU88132.1 hypothetical protein C9J27_25710 [Photobacterium kishitanii]
MSSNLNKIASNSNYDMSPWYSEKSLSVVKSLAGVVDEIRGSNNETIIPELLYSAIYNATKLAAFSFGATWDINDAEMIYKNGSNDIDKLLVKYGLLDKTEEDKNSEHIKSCSLKIIELLNTEEYFESRTKIHEILAKINSKDIKWEELKELTEQLTLKELQWDKYKNNAYLLLRNILAEME